MPPKTTTKATAEQKAKTHAEFDMPQKLIFASKHDKKDDRDEIRTIEYRMLAAMFYLVDTKNNNAKFGIEGILDPRNGEAHMAKLHADNHVYVVNFVRYMLYEKCKGRKIRGKNTGDANKLAALYKKWNTELNAEINKFINSLPPSLSPQQKELLKELGK